MAKGGQMHLSATATHVPHKTHLCRLAVLPKMTCTWMGIAGGRSQPFPLASVSFRKYYSSRPVDAMISRPARCLTTNPRTTLLHACDTLSDSNRPTPPDSAPIPPDVSSRKLNAPQHNWGSVSGNSGGTASAHKSAQGISMANPRSFTFVPEGNEW